MAGAWSQWPVSEEQAKVLNSKLSCSRLAKAKTSKGLISLWVSAKSPKLGESSGLRDWEKDLISNPHFTLGQIFNTSFSEESACIHWLHTKHTTTSVSSKHVGLHVCFYPVKTNDGTLRLASLWHESSIHIFRCWLYQKHGMDLPTWPVRSVQLIVHLIVWSSKQNYASQLWRSGK